MLARSVAQTFAVKEDAAGFLGDGTGTYGSITGLASALAAGSKVTATARLTFGVLTFADFESVVGKAKRWGGSTQKWYISRAGWAASMSRLLNAAGGNDIISLANGPKMMFLGHEVVLTETLESRLTGTTGATACYFGDLRSAAFLGSRREISLAVDTSRYFEKDMIALRATERYDIKVHDVGDASNPGGVVALIFG